MTPFSNLLVANGIKCLDALHKVFVIWVIAAAGLVLLPSESDSTFRLTLFDVPVRYILATTLLAVVMFAIGFVASELLGQVRSISRRLTEANELVLLLSYPSIATFRTAPSRSALGCIFTFLQFIVGIVVATPKHSYILWPQITFALFFSLPMAWFTYRLTTWAPADIDAIRNYPIEG